MKTKKNLWGKILENQKAIWLSIGFVILFLNWIQGGIPTTAFMGIVFITWLLILNFKYETVRDENEHLKVEVESLKESEKSHSEYIEFCDKFQRIKIGWKKNEVDKLLGEPLEKHNIGNKILYKYGNRNIIFSDGKVIDINIE